VNLAITFIRKPATHIIQTKQEAVFFSSIPTWSGSTNSSQKNLEILRTDISDLKRVLTEEAYPNNPRFRQMTFIDVSLSQDGDVDAVAFKYFFTYQVGNTGSDDTDSFKNI
jgi:hypothetical protein